MASNVLPTGSGIANPNRDMGNVSGVSHILASRNPSKPIHIGQCGVPIYVKCSQSCQYLDPRPSTTKNSDRKLPPLVSSLIIPGLPQPPPPNPHARQAADLVHNFMRRFGVDKTLASYSEVCLSFAASVCPAAPAPDRLAALAVHWTLICVLDDAFFDPQSTKLRETLQRSGVSIRAEEAPEFARQLDVVFRQEERPPDGRGSVVELMWWEVGCEMRRLSNVEWFTRFADAVSDYWNASIQCHMSGCELDDLESYTRIRAREFGGPFTILQLEFARNVFLPDEVRRLPVFQRVTDAAAVQSAFVNDIFSFAKERRDATSQNLIKVLMRSEELSFAAAAWRAVGLANSYSCVILELELEMDIGLEGVRLYMEDLKCLLSGYVVWLSRNKRYRCPDSPFLELRNDHVMS